MDVSTKSVEEIDDELETENSRKIEAALFIAGRFLSIKELVALTDVNPILLRKILEDLKDKYKSFAMEIIEKDERWKMDVAQEYVWIVNKLASGSSEFTSAEKETLAIIAHKQPIKQSVVIKIRGNKAYEHVKNFVSMGLIKKKKIGHTAELTVSDGFYDYFRINKSEKFG